MVEALGNSSCATRDHILYTVYINLTVNNMC